MDTKHTPTPWKLERLTFGGYHNIGIRVSGEVVSGYTAFINTRWPNENQCAEQEANAAFIVKAVNTHDQWAKWIVQRGMNLPDHACAECVPGGEIVKAGFQCVYHEALAETEGK